MTEGVTEGVFVSIVAGAQAVTKREVIIRQITVNQNIFLAILLFLSLVNYRWKT